VPKLKLKGKISKEKGEKISKYSSILLAVAIGLYFLFDMGAAGLWISPWSWILGIILAVMVMFNVYRSTNRALFKKLLAFVLLCIMFTIPLFVVINVTSTQSTAQNLSTAKDVDYFKNLLGTSYNYTELIIWENQHLNFTYGNIDRNDDPIKIYEYGKGRCQEFATLYATLCISQGYRCRIVDNILNDHVFNEVLLPNGTWTRVDASLNPTGSGAVGNQMFFEDNWGAPILSLAFENSSITDVTSTYRSDNLSLLSQAPLLLIALVSTVALIGIVKYLIAPKTPTQIAKWKPVISSSFRKHRNEITLFLLAILIIVIWSFYYFIGLPTFDQQTATNIYIAVISGMSALLSVSIAVIVFRIQSLENRSQTLEQQTLNYIHQTTQWSYPTWSDSVEQDIKNGSITARYALYYVKGGDDFVKEETARQQKRLTEALDSHNQTKETIKSIRKNIGLNLIFLVTPILLSLYLLLVTSTSDTYMSYYAVTFVILLSTFGIVLLIATVKDSIAPRE
jgi:hypothetical protein